MSSRKAQVYSLVAILLSIPILFFLTYYITASQNLNYGSMEKVVSDQIHDVEKSIQEDFSRGLEIAGHRSLIALAQKAITDGSPVEDSLNLTEELITAGTINGSEKAVMENNTLQDWVQKVLSIEVGFDKEINYSSIHVSSSGFHINLETNLTVNLSHSQGLVAVNKKTAKSVPVSLLGLEDPLFPLNTRGFARRSITKFDYPFYTRDIVSCSGTGNCSGRITFDPAESPKTGKILVTHNASGISGFTGVVSETSDLPSVSCYLVSCSNAVDLVNSTLQESNYSQLYIDGPTSSAWSLPIKAGIENNSYYSQPGPDIFHRLENNLTSVSTGIQTFVNTEELESLGIEPKETQTRVAYLYFSNQTINGQTVRGLPDWFRIDAENAGRYNLTQLLE